MATFAYTDPLEVGNTLYAFAQPYGVNTYANLSTQAFEAYNVAHWGNYAITMTESPPGEWTGTWPSWFASGTYYLSIRQQLGGSPASSDGAAFAAGTETYVGPGPPPPPPPPSTLPTAAGTWYVQDSSNYDLDSGFVTSRPADLSFWVFDLQYLPQIQAGAVITAALLVEGGGTLTLTNQQFGSYSCGATITGGASGTDYIVTAELALSDGTVLNPEGVYRVRA